MNFVATPSPENDGAAPLDLLAALCEARGWQHTSETDQDIVIDIAGSWTSYQLRCVWRPEDRVLQLLCLPDIQVPDAKRATVFELLALINEQIWLGHFDIWSNGGVLLYRHGLMLGDDGLLSVGQGQSAVETAIGECDRFYPAFQFALWGDKSPQDALANALVDPAGEA